MNNDKILELARRCDAEGDTYWTGENAYYNKWVFQQGELIAFAQSVINAEREKYQELIAAAEAAVVSCWRLDTDITEEIAALRKLLEGLKEKAE